MLKRKLDNNDLKKHFDEQIQFLKLSCDSFDKGFDAESKRIAVTIRILVHETKNSHSLLNQMGLLNIDFYSSTIKDGSENPFPYSGLVMTKLGFSGTETKYVAMLDEGPEEFKKIPFEEWWEGIIFDDKRSNKLSRKEIILTAANQDGGAHIDPEIEEMYAKISKDNYLGWNYIYKEESRPILGLEKVAIRQIGHEILKTLLPDYKKISDQKGNGVIFGGMRLMKGPLEPEIIKKVKIVGKHNRNEKCPCGSGIKFKKCHW